MNGELGFNITRKDDFDIRDHLRFLFRVFSSDCVEIIQGDLNSEELKTRNYRKKLYWNDFLSQLPEDYRMLLQRSGD